MNESSGRENPMWLTPQRYPDAVVSALLSRPLSLEKRGNPGTIHDRNIPDVDNYSSIKPRRDRVPDHLSQFGRRFQIKYTGNMQQQSLRCQLHRHLIFRRHRLAPLDVLPVPTRFSTVSYFGPIQTAHCASDCPPVAIPGFSANNRGNRPSTSNGEEL